MDILIASIWSVHIVYKYPCHIHVHLLNVNKNLMTAMMDGLCNLNTCKVETRGSWVQGQPWTAEVDAISHIILKFKKCVELGAMDHTM